MTTVTKEKTGSILMEGMEAELGSERCDGDDQQVAVSAYSLRGSVEILRFCAHHTRQHHAALIELTDRYYVHPDVIWT